MTIAGDGACEKTYRPIVSDFKLSIGTGDSGGRTASAATECMCMLLLLRVLPDGWPDVVAVRKAFRYGLYFRPKVKSKSPRGKYKLIVGTIEQKQLLFQEGQRNEFLARWSHHIHNAIVPTVPKYSNKFCEDYNFYSKIKSCTD